MLRDARLAHPRHDPAGLLSGDQSGDGAVQTPRQIRRGAQGTGQIEHPPNCIDSSVHVKWSPHGARLGASAPPSGLQGNPTAGRGRDNRAEITRVCRINHPEPGGQFRGRQIAEAVGHHRLFRGRRWAVLHDRGHSFDPTAAESTGCWSSRIWSAGATPAAITGWWLQDSKRGLFHPLNICRRRAGSGSSLLLVGPRRPRAGSPPAR